MRVPVQFRLPAEIREYLREEAADRHTTQTGVVVEALELLRKQRLETLMAEGYSEMAEADLVQAEEGLADYLEHLPEW